MCVCVCVCVCWTEGITRSWAVAWHISGRGSHGTPWTPVLSHRHLPAPEMHHTVGRGTGTKIWGDEHQSDLEESELYVGYQRSDQRTPNMISRRSQSKVIHCPRRWHRTGTMVEAHHYLQYMVRLDGSVRVTIYETGASSAPFRLLLCLRTPHATIINKK